MQRRANCRHSSASHGASPMIEQRSTPRSHYPGLPVPWRATCTRAATLALQAGVPLWKVSAFLGHRDLATTARIYAHLTPEGREEVAERMHEVLTDGAVSQLWSDAYYREFVQLERRKTNGQFGANRTVVSVMPN